VTAWAGDAVAELAARAALTCRPLERVLVAVCHRPRLRRLLKAGAVAVSYPNLLHRAERRAIDTGAFKHVVDLAEHRGAHAYFFESPQPSRILDHIIKPGAICADVGANVGPVHLRARPTIGRSLSASRTGRASASPLSWVGLPTTWI
jgi:hypothetical protein